MIQFDFATVRKIVFGPGRFAELGMLAAAHGRRPLLVTGTQSLAAAGGLDRVAALLSGAGLAAPQVLTFSGEPTVEQVDSAVLEATAFAPDVVIAIGGGSVIDAAKAVAALLVNGGEAIDYLEGVGRGLALSKPALPVIACPTTAGTGSEVTRNAVLGDAAHTFKRSLRSDGMLPAVALVDPELTYSLPLPITAASGMDAITQLLEAYTSRRAHPMSDALATQGLTLAGELPFLGAALADPDARQSMAMASLLGGICLANVGLGAVHGLASPIGARFTIPHGVICAALLPPVVLHNARVAWEQENSLLLLKYQAAFEVLAGFTGGEADDEDEDDEALEPGGTMGQVLDVTAGEWQTSSEAPGPLGEVSEFIADDDPDEEDEVEEAELARAYYSAQQLSQFFGDLNASLRLRGLAAFGVRREHFAQIIAEGRGNSMQTNPVDLSDDDLLAILEGAL